SASSAERPPTARGRALSSGRMRRLLPLLWGLALASPVHDAAPAIASDTAAAPAPEWARSAEVISRGAPVVAAPAAGAARRGTVALGARLPLEARVFGDGCPAGVYVRVGARRYVCETHLRPSPEPPGGQALPRMSEG